MEPKRRRIRALAAAAASITGLVLLAPASGNAATTVGQVDVANNLSCDPGVVYLQGRVPDGSPVTYTVPAAGGVITSWSTASDANGGSGSLKVLRVNSLGNADNSVFAVVGASPLQALTPGAIATFPARIPVQGGDRLGYGFPSGPEQSCVRSVGPNAFENWGGLSNGALGSVFTTRNEDASSHRQLNVSASVEPDADRDGFGDESQDRCRGQAGNNQGCPPGVTPGVPGGTGADKTKPTFAALSFSRTTFAAARSGGAFSSQKGRKKTPVGTKVSFNLSEAAGVRFTVQRKTTGRRSSGKCRTRTRANRKKPRCTLYKNVSGSFSVRGKAGKNSFTFRGRIGGKALKTGSYRLNGTATDPAKNRSAPKNKKFRIVR